MQVAEEPKVAVWITASLKARGWRVADLERASGVRRGTIERALKGERTPQHGTIHRLADALNVRRQDAEDYLLGRSERVPLPSQLSQEQRYPAGTTTRIPMYHSVSAARTDLRDDEVQDWVTVEAGTPRRFVVPIDGHCMEPQLPSGCRAVCDFGQYEQDKILSGRVYWVRFTNDETTLKRVVIDGADLIFTCDNPAFRSFRRPATDVAMAALVVEKLEAIR